MTSLILLNNKEVMSEYDKYIEKKFVNYKCQDSVMKYTVFQISRMIKYHQEYDINVDYADILTVLESSSRSIFFSFKGSINSLIAHIKQLFIYHNLYESNFPALITVFKSAQKTTLATYDVILEEFDKILSEDADVIFAVQNSNDFSVNEIEIRTLIAL